MALSNFVMTVVAVGAAYMLLRGDVRQSGTVLRRNLRHIRQWLEEESAAASKAGSSKPKEMESGGAGEKASTREGRH